METYQENGKETIKNIFKGIGISMIFTIVCLFIFSVLLTYTNISESTIITAISILIGSSIGNTKIKKNGILNGAFVGGGYILILYLISSILNVKFSLNVQSIIMIAVGILFGMLGGIIGVNKK